MPPEFDLICFSHLRWGFVYQRPQHLLSRCARERRVYYVEEPLFDAPSADDAYLATERLDGVLAIVPHLPEGLTLEDSEEMQRRLLGSFFEAEGVRSSVVWFYTPMAVPLARDLEPLAAVYDCMDELTAFAWAASAIRDREAELYQAVDLVFTGGRTLYEAKRSRHPRVHLFPSSVDVAHFAKARRPAPDPDDQAAIPRPRLGFFGVFDERIDQPLVAAVARLRPEWQFVFIGPFLKIDETLVPRAPNIAYLGLKRYEELPAYAAGWDVGILPFALNESTRFISPTKTPEYLAAGLPVVSTPIADVVVPYGEEGLAEIADGPEEFVAAVERVLARDHAPFLERADAALSAMSWDRTWSEMRALIESVVAERTAAAESASRP